ncbi:hypothetical protein XI06_34605 [Bradyrhizobium sp. CCBAU 11434]|uniref:hypothetical protein n=1 Tax=Bradyrhizobium sp. CCBAU 11434 TaxID=1630885 RepID=UPI00230566A8|nr:hypothetical protein [Bradyrhizobium sp. CCBAU 11434]MDA9525304.1 hypothetical protein [Bradyrhizobium sp. CCBAU 11434]
MRLPWPLLFGYAVVNNWFVTIPLALALAFSAWYGSPWIGGLRFVLIACAAFLALPFPAAGALYLYQSYDATKYWRTLETGETIADLPLPAGSKIQFADKAHSIVVLIELPQVTEILGMRLTGTLKPWKRQGNDVTHWGGDLHGYQIIDGLPCKGGPYANDRFGGVLFDKAGTLHRFTLGAPHELLGLKLPDQTTIRRGNDMEPWSFLLSASEAYIPMLDTMAPVGVTLEVAGDGRLVRIRSGHGQTIVLRGVPLNSKSFEVVGGTVVSQLAEPFAVGGDMRPAGTPVRIGLDTGEMSVVSE